MELDPVDCNWKLALIDWWEERGESVLAECMRWVVEKGRVPDADRGHEEKPRRIWWAHIGPTSELPWKLVDDVGRVSNSRKTFSTAYDRLLTAWYHSTPEQRKEYKQWQPSSSYLTSGVKS